MFCKWSEIRLDSAYIRFIDWTNRCTYGDGKHNRFFRDYFGCRRLLLFSMGLLLDHPRAGDALRLIAPLD